MSFCRNCGVEVTGEMVYCPNCGQRLVIPEASPLKTDEVHDYTSRNTSGQGALAVVPPQIKGWNWGAFLLGWWWGIGNNTYISFLTLIPYVGQIIMPFVLGAKGNKWAWRNKQWQSIERFRTVQKQWALGGLILVIVSLVICAVIIALS